jgi:hypothetical protein
MQGNDPQERGEHGEFPTKYDLIQHSGFVLAERMPTTASLSEDRDKSGLCAAALDF